MTNKTEAEQIQHEKMLQEVKIILDKLKIKNVLTGSALLGFYRDGCLRPNCLGVLLTCAYNDVKPKENKITNRLVYAGFKIERHYKNENWKIRASKGRLQVEIVGYSFDGNIYYRKLKNKIKYFRKDFFDDVKEIEFNNFKYIVPNNIIEFLEYCYKDWKTPVNKECSPSNYKSENHMRLN